MPRHLNTATRIGRRGVTVVAVLLSLCAVAAQAQNRMPPIPDEEMTDAQREAAEEFRGDAWRVERTVGRCLAQPGAPQSLARRQ